MNPVVEVAVESRCLLGEGPVWDELEGLLYWVDIKAPALHRLHPDSGEVRTWPMPEPIGCFALREAGGMVVALKSGVHIFDPATGEMRSVARPEPNRPGNRLNDGKCDARGRFWFGSMDDAEVEPTGQLYRLDPDLAVTRFEAGFVVTNGPAFTGDGRRMYFTDSSRRCIYAYDYDLETGALGERRLFARLADEHGYPDGMCLDSDDSLWGAHWDGAHLTRYAPDGEVLAKVSIPAPRVTCCCFGGADLDVLYVTTARTGLDEAALASAPLSGSLFRVTGLGVRGLPMPRFAG